jgi:hypothetical protein
MVIFLQILSVTCVTVEQIDEEDKEVTDPNQMSDFLWTDAAIFRRLFLDNRKHGSSRAE